MLAVLAALDWPFVGSIVGCGLIGLAARSPQIAGTALVLLINWTLCTACVEICGDAYPWLGFLVVDYLAAWALLVPVFDRPNFARGIVGLIYAGEIIAHAAFGTSDRGPWAVYNYWYLLHYAAWAQLLAVFLWGVYAMAGRYLVYDRGPSHSSARAPGPNSARDSVSRGESL